MGSRNGALNEHIVEKLNRKEINTRSLAHDNGVRGGGKPLEIGGIKRSTYVVTFLINTASG
eukprot:2180243-Lingulodinium_polyedra.AAC.1